MKPAAHAGKVKASFLLGACGDAFGAPLEGIRTLKGITDLYGEHGLSEIIAFENAYELGQDYPAGRVTDDTTMAMTTAAAFVLALQAPGHDFDAELRRLLWQGYINWGALQLGGEDLANLIDPSIAWPDEVKPFWFACGAGRGTIAALLEGHPGTLENPLTYNRVVRGKEMQGPNPGCGGMMRVTPLALVPGYSATDIFHLACRSAAVTHGHPVAYVATGIVALWMHWAMKNEWPQDLVTETDLFLSPLEDLPVYRAGVRECLRVLWETDYFSEGKTPSFHGIDDLPQRLGYKNAFLAAPVLAQVLYALESCRSIKGVRRAMTIAVNHGGDSDSVGAIVGNVLGALHGPACVPKNWANVITQRTEIDAMADLFVTHAPK